MGGRGIYPCERRFPGGTRFRAGGGAGVNKGGNSVDVGGVADVEADSGSLKVTGVTFGANVTGRCGKP